MLTPVKGKKEKKSKNSTPAKKFLTENEVKNLEIQAIQMMDSDISGSKQLIEQCLHRLDEEKFPILENM